MTGHVIPLQGDHLEIQALLPWYLTDGLDPAEAAVVRAHLGVCPECQAELAAERRLAAGMADLPDPAPVLDVEQGLAAARTRIERDRRRTAPFAGVVAAVAALRRGWSGGEPWMRWAVAAQACLVLTMGAALWVSLQPADYRALGAAPPAGAVAEPVGNALIVFRPDAAEAELRAILRQAEARLVDGPTATDAYVIRVPSERRDEVLAALKARDAVVLAEPLDPGGPS